MTPTAAGLHRRPRPARPSAWSTPSADPAKPIAVRHRPARPARAPPCCSAPTPASRRSPSYVLNAALDPALPDGARPARRCGVITTDSGRQAHRRLLMRFRTHLTCPAATASATHLAEEARVLAFTGPPTAARPG